jgi:ABC-type nitrate/sulfonate/bicarbonate transport system substrate-binding protein
VKFQWHEYKLGTGQMINALKSGECDVIVALTEGLVADIAQGSSLRIIGTYVESPLTWAISAAPDSKYNEVADLKGATIGISRFTSGSHLMTCVLGSQRGWDQSDVQFVVQGSFENLRKGVNSGASAAFMW